MSMQFKTQSEAHEYLRTLPKPAPFIHPTAILYPNVEIKGADVGIGPYSVIGKEGFGFDPKTAFRQRWPHIGKVIINDGVEIGANVCIDRGTLGDTVIGENTKIDNLVHIAHNVQIGKGCVIVAGSVIGGSAILGDGVFVGMGALVRDHVKIGEKAFVGMGAIVTKSIRAGARIKPVTSH